MDKPAFGLADIIKDYGTAFEIKHNPLNHHRRVLNAIRHCRTAYFGGHVDRCSSCNHIRVSYNSCRNRHCPTCQAANRERWIEQREKDLLPVSYFHVVFTLPHELNPFCLKFPKELYNILFEASTETIETFAADPKHLGAKTGMICVLHTWGQNLSLHPHIHMIIPGGGISDAGYWKHTKNKENFLFPVKAMSIVYKNKFMEKLMRFLQKEKIISDKSWRRKLYNLKWVVYSKQPFAGPKQVIEYLGRYTHKIAISNHRIKRIDKGNISFSYKDYAHGSIQKIMTLNSDEFLRRFCMHILPPGFRKIRHYGILANRSKSILKKQLFRQGIIISETKTKETWKEFVKRKMNFDVDACPCCKTGKMIRVMSFDAHAPPELSLLRNIKKR